MRAFLVSQLMVLALCSSCATNTPTRAEVALKRIEAAVDAYGRAHPRETYPRDLKELSAFARSIGQPLDLSPFSPITLVRSRPTSMSILYQTRGPSREAGVLGYSSTAH